MVFRHGGTNLQIKKKHLSSSETQWKHKYIKNHYTINNFLVYYWDFSSGKWTSHIYQRLHLKCFCVDQLQSIVYYKNINKEVQKLVIFTQHE